MRSESLPQNGTNKNCMNEYDELKSPITVGVGSKMLRVEWQQRNYYSEAKKVNENSEEYKISRSVVS